MARRGGIPVATGHREEAGQGRNALPRRKPRLLGKARLALATLLKPGQRLLVGVSGGADSVALLHALVELGYQPHVCHLNHQWRGAESDADAEFVRAVAGKLHLPATVAARPVEHTENVARRARHAFFQDCARQARIRTLALAHTADDQAETFLLRLIRGAGPTGLGGMGAERNFGKLRIIRPLLEVSRAEVIEYLQARGLSWREDASNRDLQFLRNRVRHVLLPLLERDFNPAIRAVLRRTAEILRAESEQDPVAAERRAIRAVLGNLSFRGVETVRKQVNLPVAGEWSVKVPGRTTLRPLGMVLECARVPARGRFPLAKKRASKLAHSKVERIDADALGTHVTIRTWRAGDRFQPLGMAKQKKLQDFFVDEKVPRQERGRVPLLCGADGRIAWVVGYRLAEPFKVTPQTRRVLRLQARR